MLSVLVVSPDPSVPGGVSVFIECMKRHLTASHVESFYIGSKGVGKESALSVMQRLFKAPRELTALVKDKKFDVVHINPSFDAKSLIRDSMLLLALRLAGYRRVLFYFHGWDFAVQGRIQRSFVKRALTRWVLNRAALITVLGDSFRDGLVAMGVSPQRLVVTQTMFEGEGLKAVQGEPPSYERPFILFMSRFDREKGGRELVRAFASLARDYPDIDLVMAGKGAEDASLRVQAQTLGMQFRIRFPGYVEDAAKWKLLRDCAIFALPTYYRSEGMPVAVLEAMGAGKPLLVGSAGALRSIVADSENGVVVEKVTPQTVEAGLRRLLSDANFAAAAGKRNAEQAWKKFEAHAVTAEIEKLYARVARC